MTELSNTFVCVMGMGTVFIGLILIVLICNLLSLVTSKAAKRAARGADTPKPATSSAAAGIALSMPSGAEKAAILAAVCACIAEELGTDADNIKVTSFKRV